MMRGTYKVLVLQDSQYGSYLNEPSNRCEQDHHVSSVICTVEVAVVWAGGV